MTRVYAAVATLMCLLLASTQPQVRADELPSEDGKLLHQFGKDFKDAVNRQDADATAGFFAEDADVILPSGEIVKGRDNIRKMYAELYSGMKGAKYTATPEIRRYIEPGVYIGDGTGEWTNPDGSEGSLKHRHTAIIRKQNGTLKFVCIRVMIPVGDE